MHLSAKKQLSAEISQYCQIVEWKHPSRVLTSLPCADGWTKKCIYSVKG